MHKWKVIVDSSSEAVDLTSLKKRVKPGVDLTFGYLSYGFTIDDDFYTDEDAFMDPDYDLDAIMHRIERAKEITTGVNAPGVVMETMEGAENVIFIALSSALSSGFQTAKTGMNLLLEEYPDVNVHVFDSRSVSGQERLLAYKAIDLINEGLNFDQVVEELNAYHASTYILFNQSRINRLIATGRIDVKTPKGIGFFHKRGLVRADMDGIFYLDDTVRGSRHSARKTLDYMEKNGYQGGRVILTNVLNDRLTRILKYKILRKYPQAELEVHPSLPTMSIYYERGAVNIAFEGQPRS